jgi:hypothetical protein
MKAKLNTALYVLLWVAVAVLWITLIMVMSHDYIEAQKVLITQ